MKPEKQNKQSDNVLEKHHAVKALVNNSAGLINWVDCGSVREDFNYALSNERQVISSSRLQVDSCIRSYTNKPIRIAMIKAVSMRNIFFINYFSNLILHAVLTQPENDSPFFLACCWINSSKSSSKRIVCLELLERSYGFFIFSCIGSNLCGKLSISGSNHYKGENHKKQSPEVLEHYRGI